MDTNKDGKISYEEFVSWVFNKEASQQVPDRFFGVWQAVSAAGRGILRVVPHPLRRKAPTAWCEST